MVRIILVRIHEGLMNISTDGKTSRVKMVMNSFAYEGLKLLDDRR